MESPATDIVGSMNECLRGMRRVVENVDFAAITPSQAAQLYRFFDAAGSVAVAGMSLVTPVIDRAPGRGALSASRRGGPRPR
jgi:hypothetical protein